MEQMDYPLRAGVRAAIDALNDKNGRGGAAKIVEKLGISHAAISQWTQVPAKQVLAVEALTGVSRHDLRPDIYGPAPRRQPRKKAA